MSLREANGRYLEALLYLYYLLEAPYSLMVMLMLTLSCTLESPWLLTCLLVGLMTLLVRVVQENTVSRLMLVLEWEWVGLSFQKSCSLLHFLVPYIMQECFLFPG